MLRSRSSSDQPKESACCYCGEVWRSIGIVSPFCECKVVDTETDEALGPNQEGEICVRGPIVMKGYIGNEAATKDTVDSNGWLHTGDVGYYDEEGFFYITDRKKELIKFKGLQVSPTELEKILLSHPQVQDAAVAPIPDETAGELPRAYIIKRPGSTLTENEIAKFVADQVSAHKRLRGGVIFVDSIPKTATGKIMRRQLKSVKSNEKMGLYLVPEWIPIPNNVTQFTVIVVLASIVLLAITKRLDFILRVNKIPGLFCGLTILGNAPMLPISSEDIFIRILGYVRALQSCGPVLRTWAGPFPAFFLFTPEAFETVLSSKKLIDKSNEYSFLHPWLGTGLLTSTGSKWSTRRKLLTPTFHFKILGDFIHIFNEQSQVLIQQLNAALLTKKDGFDIYPFITRCTLDIICETAMGCNIEAQTRVDSEYLLAVLSMCRILNVRTIQPLMRSDILFNFSSYGAQQRRNLKILHGFTDSVIQNKKLERNLNKGTNTKTTSNEEGDFSSTKKRLAFLDLLIDASKDGELLSDSDIREEVDTFMFEGHDTSTAAIGWSLHLIGSDPRVTELVNQELERVFGDSNRPVDMNDLSELKYLECCIKEALRLYPSVPLLGRKLREDTVIHDYTIPAIRRCCFLQRFFEDNSRGRHPFAYVPFSAGPRNCIGQKFAMMEQKVILANIFRNFHVQVKDHRDEIVLMNEVVLRPRDGINLHLTPRLKEIF
uniref:Uncharacterized protein n=1 Tax=Daphnia galeata TaxID=27404 RepID=A0A8J2S500_9CRUS|nr:unnamed protein product [Daphnia galeata]